MEQIEEDFYKIKSGDKEFEASQYQVEIFKTIKKGVNNLIINASAGSSKTTTIVNALRFIPQNKKILFVAFNKDIVEKLKQEVEHPNVNVCTFHSLGFSILSEYFSSCARDHQVLEDLEYIEKKIDIYKYTSFINNIDLSSYNILGKTKNSFLNNVKKLVDYSRYYLAFTEKEISKIAEIYGIVPIANEFQVTREILLWGKENLSSIDYTDMIWLPNVLNLTTKKNLYDWIFIDEAQDTSIAEQNIIEKCFKRGCKFVSVGDNFQQINVWAGATEEAINLFEKHPNTITLPLPISYRCPKKVVELAKKYSDNIIAADNAIDGEIHYDVSENTPKCNDMILCRTTAPLVELFLKYIKEGKKCFIRGSKNISERYNLLIAKTKSNLIDKNCVTPDGLVPKLYIELFDLIEKLKNLGLEEDDIFAHPNTLELYDDIDAITILSESLTSTEELINKINTIFNTEEEGIELSTIHKAKGLEADNVFIYQPSLMPLSFAKKDWEKKTENNLIYVAYTRAKKTLNFIKEDPFRLNSCSNEIKIKKKLELIKEKIQYSKELGISEKNYEKKEEKPKIKLGEEAIPVQKTQSKKQKAGLKLKNLL